MNDIIKEALNIYNELKSSTTAVEYTQSKAPIAPFSVPVNVHSFFEGELNLQNILECYLNSKRGNSPIVLLCNTSTLIKLREHNIISEDDKFNDCSIYVEEKLPDDIIIFYTGTNTILKIK